MGTSELPVRECPDLFEPIFWNSIGSTWMKTIFSVVMLVVVVLQIRNDGFWNRYRFLSYQVELLTNIFAVASSARAWCKTLGLQRVSHLHKWDPFMTSIFHLSLSLQGIVFFLYWLFGVDEDLEIIKETGNEKIEFLYSIFQHLVYFVWQWFVLLTERTNLTSKNFKWILAYAAWYISFSWAYVRITSEPIYSILDWRTPATLILITIAFGISFLGFYLALRISQSMNKLYGFKA